MLYYFTDFVIALAMILALGSMLAHALGLTRFHQLMLPLGGGIVFALCFIVSHMIARLV